MQTGLVADEKMRQILELLPVLDLVPGAADKLLTSDLDPLTNFQPWTWNIGLTVDTGRLTASNR